MLGAWLSMATIAPGELGELERLPADAAAEVEHRG
jgi:hypothetical protein